MLSERRPVKFVLNAMMIEWGRSRSTMLPGVEPVRTSGRSSLANPAYYHCNQVSCEVAGVAANLGAAPAGDAPSAGPGPTGTTASPQAGPPTDNEKPQ